MFRRIARPSLRAVPIAFIQMARQGQSKAPPAGQQQQQQPEPPKPPQKPSEPPKFVTMAKNDKGVMTINMNRPPVNSLSLEMFQELNQWLLWIGYEDEFKGVVLSSAIPTVFSAGLDINELYKPKPERFASFWTHFQELWMILNTFPKPLVAAVNGNSPAGGCVLALSCDYRVMARGPQGKPERQYRIGLNETKLGFGPPPWVLHLAAYTMGFRKAERMLQLGETPTAEEALKVGLVDVVVDEEQCLQTAVKETEKYIAIPNEARWMTKDMMRRELFQFISTEEERKYDTEFAFNMLNNPDTIAHVGKYLERLKQKK